MANIESSDRDANAPESTIDRTRNGSVTITRRELRKAEREFRAGTRNTPKTGPVRSLATIGAVVALMAGVAIPAYAATTNDGDAPSVSAHEAAEQNAQTLAVGSDVKASKLSVSKYAATTPEEIEEKKAAEEAAKRAKEEAAAAAAAEEQAANQGSSAAASSAAASSGATSSVKPIGGVASPLPSGSYTISRSVGSGHDGADLVASAGTPIYAVKSGTVVTSSESYYGYGVGIVIQHADGTETTYGHMTYGSRLVQAGQKVSAGQQIGQVGNTGHSFGSHLHIELHVNGAIVDPVPALGL